MTFWDFDMKTLLEYINKTHKSDYGFSGDTNTRDIEDILNGNGYEINIKAYNLYQKIGSCKGFYELMRQSRSYIHSVDTTRDGRKFEHHHYYHIYNGSDDNILVLCFDEHTLKYRNGSFTNIDDYRYFPLKYDKESFNKINEYITT